MHVPVSKLYLNMTLCKQLLFTFKKPINMMNHQCNGGESAGTVQKGKSPEGPVFLSPQPPGLRYSSGYMFIQILQEYYSTTKKSKCAPTACCLHEQICWSLHKTRCKTSTSNQSKLHCRPVETSYMVSLQIIYTIMQIRMQLIVLLQFGALNTKGDPWWILLCYLFFGVNFCLDISHQSLLRTIYLFPVKSQLVRVINYKYIKL